MAQKKGKGNNTAAKVKQGPRADGLRRVMLVRDNKARMVWMNAAGEVVG